ncbi:MAG: lipopolysaccharide biosynthesis protein [Pseudolabrys sp.]
MAMVGSQRGATFSGLAFADLFARARTWLTDGSDSRVAQRAAGNVFLVRIGSAMLALISQVLLARWMGSYELGIYIYVWTWVLMIGALSDGGLSSAARRFIPEYTELKAYDRLRGFLSGSRWLAFAIATALSVICGLGVFALRPWLDHFTVVPLLLACLTLPIYGLVQVQVGIAQAYNWPNLALMPFYIWRQLLLTLLMGAAYLFGFATDAVTAMLVAVATIWLVTLGQLVVLDRRLKAKTRAGRKRYEPKLWLATSLPILMVEGFYLLLTYVDIIALEHFGTPDQVAIYFAAARILAIVAFVYFAIANVTTHKFTQYHVRGDRKRLAAFFAETCRWTFWPSLGACVLILAFGYPLLSLFGPQFTAGYGVMFILAAGMLSRATVGPAERLLNMLGDRKQCAAIYALAFAINLGLCIVLIPTFGIEGAALATSSALIVESVLLFIVVRRRLRPPTRA